MMEKSLKKSIQGLPRLKSGPLDWVGPNPILTPSWGRSTRATHTDTQTQMRVSSLHRVGRWLLWAPACPEFILQ